MKLMKALPAQYSSQKQYFSAPAFQQNFSSVPNAVSTTKFGGGLDDFGNFFVPTLIVLVSILSAISVSINLCKFKEANKPENCQIATNSEKANKNCPNGAPEDLSKQCQALISKAFKK